jgi:acyl carrier protein
VTENEILNVLNRILRDLLLDDSITLTMDTKREEVPNWDSAAYVDFIVSVEMQFGMKFRIADVESFPDVGAIVRKISAVLITR